MEKLAEKEKREVLDRNYDKLTLEEQRELHELFQDKNIALDMKKKLEKVIFRYPAPTPAEYLDHRNGWITKAFQDSVYDHVKEDFLEILDPVKNYSQIIEYGATRTGKSYMSRMLIHYIIIYIHCFRHPQLYYGLAPTTNLSIYIMSFVAEKVNQLLLDPIYKILEMSPRFKKEKFQDKVAEEQYKNGLDNIHWSKAGTGSKLTLESQLTLNIGTDFMSFIGSDLLFLTVSEINFFIEKAGVSHEQIFQLYSDGVARIKATVGDNYLGCVYLDSSANDEENPIERYILDELPKQKDAFFRQRAKWEENEEGRKAIGSVKLPIWEKTGEIFTVCKGDKNFVPKIIDDKDELKQTPKNLIVSVPIDLRDNFKRNILKAIKDDCGIPTRKENKFIQDMNIVDDLFNNKLLPNIEFAIIADASQPPEKLIWDKIHNKFFSKYDIGKYVVSRAHGSARFIGLDPAYSVKGDTFGIAMCHKEWSKDLNKIMYVFDFCFGIEGEDTGINLDAISHFILDLTEKGMVHINSVAIDQFQSQSLIQTLTRYGINISKQSVDRDVIPYTAFHTYLLSRNIKMGKNIIIKNNLNSLITTDRKGKEVIDHTQGRLEKIYNGNFELSSCGINAKDCSDSACQAFYLAVSDPEAPSVIYEEENMKHSDHSLENLAIICKTYEQIHKYY